MNPGLRSVLAAALLVTSSARLASQPSSVTLVPEGERSSHFAAVQPHLELGGTFFAYADIDGDVDRLGAYLQQVFASLPADEPQMAMLKQDYTAILHELGLADLKAIGLSSVAVEGGFRNRTFLYTPEGRRGFLGMVGGPAHAFDQLALAPADADLYWETELDVGALVAAVQKVAERVGGTALRNVIDQQLAQPTPVGGLTAGELIGAIPGRMALVVRLDPAQPPVLTPGEPFSLPGADFALRAEHLGVLFEPLAGAAAGLAERTTEGGLDLLIAEALPNTAQPLLIAREGDALWIASGRAFFDVCHARTGGLAEAPAVKSALAAIGNQGNGLSYVSPSLLSTVKEWIGQVEIPEASEHEVEAAKVRAQVLGMIVVPSRPLVSVRTNLPDGVLVQSFWTTSQKENVAQLVIANPVTIGFLAAMAIPAFQKVRTNSQEKSVENNLRMLSAGADQFMLEHGVTSATYADIVGEDKYVPAITPVAGESYEGLVINQDDTQITVELPDGREVSIERW